MSPMGLACPDSPRGLRGTRAFGRGRLGVVAHWPRSSGLGMSVWLAPRPEHALLAPQAPLASFAWLICAPRWIRGTGMPPGRHEARIGHDNRTCAIRLSDASDAWDGGDVSRGGLRGHSLTTASMASRRAGWPWAELARPGLREGDARRRPCGCHPLISTNIVLVTREDPGFWEKKVHHSAPRTPGSPDPPGCPGPGRITRRPGTIRHRSHPSQTVTVASTVGRRASPGRGGVAVIPSAGPGMPCSSNGEHAAATQDAFSSL
jgi:hypothetical protein